MSKSRLNNTYQIQHAIIINAAPELLWQHITEVDIAAFDHPAYFRLLGIPKPLRAEISQTAVPSTRTAYFENGRRFIQQITTWNPHTEYGFIFQADPGFRVAYLLDLSRGPFQMVAGNYQIEPLEEGVRLTLTSDYRLSSGAAGLLLWLPVRLVLSLFQRYLLRGIKANAEREQASHA